jgi:hypothetical protein
MRTVVLGAGAEDWERRRERVYWVRERGWDSGGSGTRGRRGWKVFVCGQKPLRGSIGRLGFVVWSLAIGTDGCGVEEIAELQCLAQSGESEIILYSFYK